MHGVLKRDVKKTMRAMNKACMDTVAACGDVCRNVLCTSRPDVCSKELHEESFLVKRNNNNDNNNSNSNNNSNNNDNDDHDNL